MMHVLGLRPRRTIRSVFFVNEVNNMPLIVVDVDIVRAGKRQPRRSGICTSTRSRAERYLAGHRNWSHVVVQCCPDVFSFDAGADAGTFIPWRLGAEVSPAAFAILQDIGKTLLGRIGAGLFARLHGVRVCMLVFRQRDERGQRHRHFADVCARCTVCSAGGAGPQSWPL